MPSWGVAPALLPGLLLIVQFVRCAGSRARRRTAANLGGFATPLFCLQAECYEYLFEAAVRMRELGLDASRPPAPPALEQHANGTANGTAEPSECSLLLCGGAAKLIHYAAAMAGRWHLPCP